MNILFLTLNEFSNINERGIYTDLVREIAKAKDINLYVISPIQKRSEEKENLKVYDNVSILRVKVGNITGNKSLIEKGFAILTLQHFYLKSIKKFFPNIAFDMILYSTPPITFSKIITFYKNRDKSFTYLMLKDIFPQNAVDMEMFSKNSLIYKYFRYKEVQLYKQSDMIGCMSQGNIDYILSHNDYLSTDKVEVLPNSIEILKEEIQSSNFKSRSYMNIPLDSTVYLYGGNLGRPQGIDFLLKVMDGFRDKVNSYLLIVGSGSEYSRIENELIKNVNNNVRLINRLPKDEYDRLVKEVDVGLIFLDDRFTIPNIPSRMTSYMENSIPIIAATDVNTDLKQILEDSGSGLWCRSGDLATFMSHVDTLNRDKSLRIKMGFNGRKYLEENYDVKDSVKKILKSLRDYKGK